ncbi:adenosine receptor A3-like isoform X1 [Bufo gargarizans]|uniref:adenosine receptor A3-like isoform X1 n=1 Tax=Bufo gargarizans TaxID=30331 RepID=UPI001CF316BF|nr:adenosine receptor A3-like isoform X1 [Bufo gargarizans]
MYQDLSNQTTMAQSLTIVYIAVEVVIGVLAIFGNTLVIWAVKVNPSLQDTTFYFIVSLAVTDLAVGVCVIPLAILLELKIHLYFHTCLFLCCTIIIFTNASTASLLAIAMDRYVRIKLPNRHRKVFTKKRIHLSISFCWTMSTIGALVPMFGWNNRPNLREEERNVLICNFPNVMSMDYLVYFCFFVWVLFPLFTMMALYVEIFYIVRQQMRKRVSNLHVNKSTYSRELKITISLVFVMGLFALCWLPISILNCISYFYPNIVRTNAFQPALYLCIVLSHLSSVINPIIYSLKIKKFKSTFIHIIKRHIPCSNVITEVSSTENTVEK